MKHPLQTEHRCGLLDQLGGVLHLEFFYEMLAVRDCGVVAYVQFFGNFLRGESVRDHVKYFGFPTGNIDIP